jgi:hypothetical protein
VGRDLAEITFMLGELLEDEVKERVGAEIERRILDPIYEWRRPSWWETADMNWNHVCNANVITTALYRIAEPEILAYYIHPLIERLGYAIHGFSDDGGCREGPGYWEYGFGHFLDAAVVLHHRTGGKLDITRAFGEKTERICRYPLASQIDGPTRTTFADSSHGSISASSAMKINRFFSVPELFGLASRRKDGAIALRDWRDLAIYEGQRSTGYDNADDHLLPELGQVVMRSSRAADRTTVAAIAGRNDVPHNHNDVGSFIYHARGTVFFVDPGAPRYTKKTFGPARYEIVFCCSRGHSVPVVNGRPQQEGSEHGGTLTVEGLDTTGPKKVAIDMTHAYDDPTLCSLVRELVLGTDGALAIADTYRFDTPPSSVEEVFMTYEEARLEEGARSVKITGADGATATLTAGAEGTFAIAPLVEESKEGRDERTLTRISFTPTRLARAMTLAFTIA